MNLTLLSGLAPTGDAATDGLAPMADNDALSSAFAQLLSERFRPVGRGADAPQLPQLSQLSQLSQLPQSLTADAEPVPSGYSLSRLLSTPELFEKLANRVERTPADAKVLDGNDDTAKAAFGNGWHTPDTPDAAALQTLLAMLPANTAMPPDDKPAPPLTEKTDTGAKPAAAASLLGTLTRDAVPSTEPSATSAPPLQAPTLPNGEMAAVAPPANNTDRFTVERTPLTADSASTPTPQHAMTPVASASLPTTPQPTAALTAAPPLNAPLGSPEWQQALSQQVLMFHRSGQHSAELRLHPQELGSLQITLKLDDQQAQLHITSAHGQVRAAAEAAIPHLRHALAESGINLGQSSVGGDASPQQSQQQQASQDHHQPSSYREQHGGAELPAETLIAPPALQALARAVDGVDIFA